MERKAYISSCGKYRYWLYRSWSSKAQRESTVMFLLLNPSTADAVKDDPTVRSCIRLAQGWKYESLYILNLFAFRATDPTQLKKMALNMDVIGPENDSMLKTFARRASKVILGWGNNGSLFGRDLQVLDLLEGRASRVCSLGLTQLGHPKHPLYIRTGTIPLAHRRR